MVPGELPLAGLRVLDFSQFLAGPLCALILADLGADVIKIERPGTGDPYRAAGPPFVNGMSAPFVALNRNKRSVTVQLGTRHATKRLTNLIMAADVVLVSFRRATLVKLGLDFDSLIRLKPDLVYCELTAYDDGGPLADQGGLDLVIQAASGLMSVTGEPDGDPMRAGVPITDYATGMVAAISVLAALRRRDKTGEPEKVQASLFGSAALLGSAAMVHAQLEGSEQPRTGNAHPHLAPYQLIATADGQLAISAATPDSWRALCRVLGEPSLDRPPFDSNAGRITNRNELTARLEERFASRKVSEWIPILEAVGVPCGPVNDYQTILHEPRWRSHLSLYCEDVLTSGGLVSPLFPAAAGNGQFVAGRRPAPTLGEHNAELL